MIERSYVAYACCLTCLPPFHAHTLTSRASRAESAGRGAAPWTEYMTFCDMAVPTADASELPFPHLTIRGSPLLVELSRLLVTARHGEGLCPLLRNISGSDSLASVVERDSESLILVIYFM